MRYFFTKMHGTGNDYIYFNCLQRELDDPAGLAVYLSRRHFSVGADGIVMICASDKADARMRMFNADGSEGKMCGNAIRCVGKYLYDNGLTDKTELDIDTLSGIKHLKLNIANGKVSSVRVDMGAAVFEPSRIPVIYSGSEVKDAPIRIMNKEWRITCVSMGNPHAVTYVGDPDSVDIETVGPLFENHPMFPERVNTEFISVEEPHVLKMRVWERGSGETYACGTGACAAVSASVLNGFCPFDEPVTVRLKGGDLQIVCTRDWRVFMTGTATKAYEGVFDDEDRD